MIYERFLQDMMPGPSGPDISAGTRQPEPLSDADLKRMQAFARVMGMDPPDPAPARYFDSSDSVSRGTAYRFFG